jgi:hypothetical protein
VPTTAPTHPGAPVVLQVTERAGAVGGPATVDEDGRAETGGLGDHEHAAADGTAGECRGRKRRPGGQDASAGGGHGHGQRDQRHAYETGLVQPGERTTAR